MRVNNQFIQISLCWSVVAFSVATVALAVQKAKISADLKNAKHKLDYMESELEGEVRPRNLRSASFNDNESENNDYRLPKSLLPKHYDLYLHPNIETGNFTGQELIDIVVVESTKQIILHAHKLNINSVYVRGAFGESLEVEKYQLDTRLEFLIVDMVEELEKDLNIKLGVLFDGPLQDKIVGLYSSSYLSANNERRVIATSKFEPTYARQAFPCFDEPAMKAVFEVTLAHPASDGYHALSNMNVEKVQSQGKYTEVSFVKSVPMSTYLVAFIVSDFAHDMKEVNTNGIDMAAVPDFAANAMEHWGLLTYRETVLLYDKDISSTWNKQRIADVLSHELAHMWFGNLVTMMWWNDLWLNEGFARYIQYKGVNAVYSDWGMLDQFPIRVVHAVMKFDSSVASHPIIQTVANPDQITEIFDKITYDKGASVIRMLEDVVGADIFEQAVTNYLTNFKYANAVSDDFITEVEKLETDFDVKSMMRTWTEQMGLPVVEVKRSSPTSFTLTQKRFFSNIEDYDMKIDDSEFNYKWTIPLTFFSDSISTVNRVWLNHNVTEVEVVVSPETKWLKFNVHQVGFYRVNYEENSWKDIIADLIQELKKFEVSDRAHLLNDVFALADASQLPYEIALDMTKYLDKEIDFVPWHVATTKLQALQVSLRYTEVYLEYLKYTRDIIAKAYNEVTWTVNEDDHLKNLLRVSILRAACNFGVSDCLTQAATRFTEWLENPVTKKPEPDLREIVYYFGMQHDGSPQSWEKMWKLFIEEQDSSEKNKIMNGLSSVRVPWLLHRFIELASDVLNVRHQDYFECIQNIAMNPVGEPIVWEYVRENWPNLVNRFGLNDRYLGNMMETITNSFSSETHLRDMEMFFAKYPDAGAGTAARKRALETVKSNIKWLQQNKEKIAGWLEKNSRIIK